MLMTITSWINSTFAEGSRPHYNTVLKWVKKKLVDHEYIGGNIYIRANATVKTTSADAAVKRIAEKL